MKEVRVTFDRKQAEGLMLLLSNFIEDWQYDDGLMAQIWQSLLIEVKEALSMRLANGFKTSFTITWRAPHALAIKGFFGDIMDDDIFQTHTGIKLLDINSQLHSNFQ